MFPNRTLFTSRAARPIVCAHCDSTAETVADLADWLGIDAGICCHVDLDESPDLADALLAGMVPSDIGELLMIADLLLDADVVTAVTR